MNAIYYNDTKSGGRIGADKTATLTITGLPAGTIDGVIIWVHSNATGGAGDGWFMVLVIAAMNLIVYLPIILGYYLEEELFHTIKISPIIRIKYKCKYACEINLSDREITSIAGQFLQIITDY